VPIAPAANPHTDNGSFGASAGRSERVTHTAEWHPSIHAGNRSLEASGGVQKLPPVGVRNLRLSDASLAEASLVTLDLTV